MTEEKWVSKSRKWFKIDLNIKCINCKNIGAGKLSNIGFGGTVPYYCPKCGKSGLVHLGGLEGYKKAFTKLKEENT